MLYQDSTDALSALSVNPSSEGNVHPPLSAAEAEPSGAPTDRQTERHRDTEKKSFTGGRESAARLLQGVPFTAGRYWVQSLLSVAEPVGVAEQGDQPSALLPSSPACTVWFHRRSALDREKNT